MAAPWLFLTVLAAGVAVAAVLVVTNLSIDTDSSRMLSADLPFQQQTQELNAAFPALKNTIVVVIRSDVPDAANAAGAALAARLELREEVSAVFAPFADAEMIGRGLLYLDPDDLDDRLTRLSKASNLIAALRVDQTLPGFLDAIDEAVSLAANADIDRASLDAMLGEAAAVIGGRLDGAPRPFAWEGALGGGDDTGVRVISLTPRLDFTALNPAKASLAAVQEEVAALDPDLARYVEIGVTGDPALRQEELRSVTETLMLSLVVSMVVVAILLWLCFRSWARAGLLLVGLVATVILSAGFAAVAVGALNLISVAFVVLLIGLGVDFAIHLMAHLETEAARKTPDVVPAVGRRLGAAFALAAGTTVLAFLAFTTTDFIGMAQLGLIGGVGVLIALGVTLTLIPAAIALRPGLLFRRERSFPPDALRRSIPRWVIAGVILLTAGGAALTAQSRFDADPMALRNAAAPSVIAFGWLAEAKRTTPYRLSVLVPDAEAAAAVAIRAEALPTVGGVTTLADLVPGDQQAKLDLIDLAWPSLDFAVNGEPVDLGSGGGHATAASLAERLATEPGPGAAALATALNRLAASDQGKEPLAGDLFRFFPQMIQRLALQLNAAPVALADLPPALVARFRSEDGRERVDIAPAADLRVPAALMSFADEVTAALPGAAGGPAQIAGAARAVSGAMLTATLIALAATALVAFLALRRFNLIVAIIVPVASAGFMTVGAGVLLGMPFNYANVIVLPLLIGYGIDTGVHIALTELGAVHEGRAARRAVIFSALTTAAAFGTLAFSSHPGTASMGALLCVALAASMLAGLVLTPLLVRRLGR